MDVLAVGAVALQGLFLFASWWLLKRRHTFISWAPLIVAAFIAIWTFLRWPLVEVAIAGPAVLWVLVTPAGIRTHPRRNGFFAAFALLAVGLLLLLLDQPRRPSSPSIIESTIVLGIHDPRQLSGVTFFEPLSVRLQPLAFRSKAAIVAGSFNVSASVIPELAKPEFSVPSRKLRFYVLLPKGTRVSPVRFEQWAPDEMRVTEKSVHDRVMLDVVMLLGEKSL